LARVLTEYPDHGSRFTKIRFEEYGFHRLDVITHSTPGRLRSGTQQTRTAGRSGVGRPAKTSQELVSMYVCVCRGGGGGMAKERGDGFNTAAMPREQEVAFGELLVSERQSLWWGRQSFTVYYSGSSNGT